MLIEPDRCPILGAGLNQVQALRDAVCWTVGGEALCTIEDGDVRKWLLRQGLDVLQAEAGSTPPIALIADAMEKYRKQALAGEWVTSEAISSSLMNPGAKEFGLKRSGAGWGQGADFCISSAFVRLLGALEQFEMDVLKALLCYRSTDSPLGPNSKLKDITVELDVLAEEPKVEGDTEYFIKPAIWTWVKPLARDNAQRRKLFERVFRLESTCGSTEADRKRHNKFLKTCYDKRNAIAHGRAGVEITLKDYLDLDAFVTRSMLHLASECRKTQRLIV
jgi:hypothetical protein